MDDDAAAEDFYADTMARYRHRDVPTIYADGILGHASANGVHRLTFVQQIFDHTPGATQTAIVPVLVLAYPTEQLVGLARSVIEFHENLARKNVENAE
ncbi:hypothetical protein ACFSTI_24955 [Rhizorhabdus histidinilytica]|uniref:Uncharacterized protein n=1 Tax=Rhizorhabdus histidinilytica TaxID=439228 RepID=A0A1T5A974_9SPHN|nr:hypothetical protein [Rhizorhabdus histidinilytica]SKB31277.1 hypothetical protein SAMN06295920_101705 [Rhizorhabdus histidinilytica]